MITKSQNLDVNAWTAYHWTSLIIAESMAWKFAQENPALDLTTSKCRHTIDV